ncbi:cyclase family protein [Zeaxanthinibacter enoshimensis]|uniref:cyclase family protein n=1 Tax=Zeaxanthinibacter enoshimensis TaxID=392009 RepID=UPI00356301CF
MIANITLKKRTFKVNLNAPLDLSIPIRGTGRNVNAWYADPPRITPYREGEFVASVSEGASINFNDIYFNPHAHGTHTETLGHITAEPCSINKQLKKYFSLAEVITIAPEGHGEDRRISRIQLEYALKDKDCTAVVIRTLPNTGQKKTRHYSHKNPPYLLEDAARYLVDRNVQHLLIDLPSVDKEKDEGALVAHRAFWNMDGKKRMDATITEFIYVPNKVLDGTYLLELQTAAFENDAAPSRPVLYKIMKDE